MTKKFDASFSRTDCVARERHGMIWSNDDYQVLEALYDQGASLREMCEALQRPAEGVLKKLETTGCIRYDAAKGVFNQIRQQQDKETIMNETKDARLEAQSAANIETKVFIRGRDAAKMSDADIFRFIGQLETEKQGLDAIQNKPKKLTAAMEALQNDIVELVKYVDER